MAKRRTIELHNHKANLADATARLVGILRQHQGSLRVPTLFARTDTLVRIARDESATRVDGLIRQPHTPRIVFVDRDWLRVEIATHVDVTMNGRHCVVPHWAAPSILSRHATDFPPLEAVVEAPCLRPDGTVLDRPGYDRGTGILFEAAARTKFPRVTAEPTDEQVARAAGSFDDLIGDFPFGGASDKAAVLAALLSTFARTAFTGPTPLFLIGSHTPGSGKTLLAKAISRVFAGRDCPAMAAPAGDDEFRKRLLPLGLEGHPLVLIDNIAPGPFGFPSLALALTSPTIQDRVITTSKTATVSMRAVWIATGNNVSLRADLARRVVRCDLDPADEHPEERTDFKHPRLLDWVQAQRPRLVRDALTILRAHAVRGFPDHGRPPFGGFEDWDQWVRGAVIHATGTDPLADRDRIEDADRQRLAAGLAACISLYGVGPDTAWYARDAIERANADDNGALDDLAAFCDAAEPASLNAKSLGKHLNAARGRRLQGRCFARTEADRKDVFRWYVAEAGP